MRRILIAGATSAIAQEAAKHFAAENASFLLAGLEPVAQAKNVSQNLGNCGVQAGRYVLSDLGTAV